MSLQRIRRAWGYFRRNGMDPGEFRLVTDGVTIFGVAEDDDLLLDTLREGQLAFFTALDEIARNVEEDTTLFELDRDRFRDLLQGSRDEVHSLVKSVSG